MNNIQSKINKLCYALKIKGYIYLLNREQFYSKKYEKICSSYKLINLMHIKEYNKLHPEDKKDPDKYEYVKVIVMKSYSKIDILKKLVEIYKQVQVGENNG